MDSSRDKASFGIWGMKESRAWGEGVPWCTGMVHGFSVTAGQYNIAYNA